MTHLSLTSRLSLLFTLAVCGTLVAAGLLFNQLGQRHFDALDQRILEEKLDAAETLLLGLGDVYQLQVIRPELQSLLGGHRDLSALILDADGRILFSEPDQDEVPQHYQQLQLHGAGKWAHNAKVWRGLQRQIARDGQRLSVLLMLNVTAHQVFLHTLTNWLWAALLVVAPGSMLLGWSMASRGLHPVRELSQTALSVSAKSPQERLPTQSVPAELLPLALAFNAILVRLEGRLPLMIEDTPAKADPGPILAHRQPVELHELCASLLDFYALPAKERGIHFELNGTGMLQGDALMLRQALSNLLANALRKTPDGATITLGIEQDEFCLSLTLVNPDAPEQLQPLCEPARCASNSENAVLGLAITHMIIEAHQGSMSCHTANGWTSLRLAFRV